MRKPFIIAAVIAVVIGGLLLVLFNVPAAQDKLFVRLVSAIGNSPASQPDGLRVVVCGSASPLGNDPTRAQACIAVLTPDHFYVFDAGAGSASRIGQARLPTGRLNGVLLTHFHSDHIADLPGINLVRWVNGAKNSLNVYGPEGVEEVISGFNAAYALDRGYRITHHGEELLPRHVGPMTPVAFRSGTVVSDGDLTIQVFSVDHSPIHPAVGYRVDYKGRSVVISGDTIAVDTLFTAAKDADLVFHDALSRTLLDIMIPAIRQSGQDRLAKVMTDVLDYHADSRNIEGGLDAAGVKQLVLYHLVPVPQNALARTMFRRGLSPNTILAEDLMVFDLPADSQEIHVSDI